MVAVKVIGAFTFEVGERGVVDTLAGLGIGFVVVAVPNYNSFIDTVVVASAGLETLVDSGVMTAPLRKPHEMCCDFF